MFSLGNKENKIFDSDNKRNNNTDRATEKEGSSSLNAPSISLPKGGGAIRGIGEKFSANPVTGTGSLTVPIFTSPGRSGFGPQLSLSYDSGSGNGSFGFGWRLSLPSITRKTDRGLPKYQDAAESDVFILSGAEDLVPVFRKKDGDAGGWMRDMDGNFVFDEEKRGDYQVRRYRPRIEGLFARIERWTRKSSGDVHWRSISKDNILTIYGKDGKSRISDPADESRIFSWLICESYDDKGNAIVYEYSAENNEGLDLSQANEHNRMRAANRYIKRILYGNRQPLLLDITKPSFRKSDTEQTDFSSVDWMFEVVFDYGEDHYKMLPLDSSIPENEQHQLVEASSASSQGSAWSSRPDPFSTYRAGFEVRTNRRCQRLLMFHNFPELGVHPCLVRSTEFDYSDFDYSDPFDVKTELHHKGSTRFASFIKSVIQSGYVRKDNDPTHDDQMIGTYLKKSLPPLNLEYSKASINEEIKVADSETLENLPQGIDGFRYQLVDLDGEGLSGILTEQAEGWFYKPGLSDGKFAPLQKVEAAPSHKGLGDGSQQLLDLAGDGKLDVVQLEGLVSGFYERLPDEESWETFVPFASLPNISWKDPNLRFIDLTGDGHADVLITGEDMVFSWHKSLAEKGFSTSERLHQPFDEEKGPCLVFNDGTQSIYLADMAGDGLTNLVRIRNGEICYWPNLGYGRFGAKVTMDNSPWFDLPDQFDQKRIRLADIDGSGVTDIIYLGRNGVQIYFNQSGNQWTNVYTLNFPFIDNVSSIQVVDILGNGTACLVWSSPLPDYSQRQLRYIDLMGGNKPHLLVSSKNNLGSETRIQYVASTKFYLKDKLDGKPWVTRLPFPVHVVERVETYDYISRNYFVTRYSYHHGYFDGVEREFRGFGMVEQYDTEELTTLSNIDGFPLANNIEASSHVPPVHTKTWFHTGIYLGRENVSNFFAGLLDAHDVGEYYREPGLSDSQAQALLLADTELPTGLSTEEEWEACRALKGTMLRQETYALDGTSKAEHPYTVTEQNFTIQLLQPQGGNRHAVFFTHIREFVNYRYERRLVPVFNGKIVDEDTTAIDSSVKWLPDPRVQHALTLEVDSFGDVMKSVAIGYGRRMDAPDSALLPEDREKQRLVHFTCTENTFTNPIVDKADAYRAPLLAETCTYELRKPRQEKSGNEPTKLYQFDAVLGQVNQARDGSHDIDYEDIGFIKARKTASLDPKEENKYFRRLIEHTRTLYRPNDLGTSKDNPLALLPLCKMQSMALPGENYKLAFTSGLLAKVFQRAGQQLLPDPANVLGGQDADCGGYLQSHQLKAEGIFPTSDSDDYWWIPAGRVFYSPTSGDTAAQELNYAIQHFYLPQRYRNPFHTDEVHTESFVRFDAYDLLMLERRDAVGNLVTAGQRLPSGQIDSSKQTNDYRVLQPKMVTDPNRNRTEVSFDALGMVVGTAAKGKEDSIGDTLNEFEPDLTAAQINAFYDVADPHTAVSSLIKEATTRIIYDLHRFSRSQEAHPGDPTQWLPAYVATLARETHVTDALPPSGLKIKISFSYSDGFEREIQKKIQAEPGPIKIDGPVVKPRWVASGWTIFNNKGKPVRQYEPFFSQIHDFEFGVQVGVSPVLFYDPAERVIATLHPNHTYEKVVFEPWQQVIYDANDTVAARGRQTGDPRKDPDIQGYMARYFSTQPSDWKTWLEQRQGGALGMQEQLAATKAVAHANTPTAAYFDTLGRPFLTLTHNRYERNGTVIDETYATRVELDIEGNQREVRDAIEQNGDKMGRIAMRYDYDMVGNRVYQLSMEAGARWILNDVIGKPIRIWDSRGHTFRTEYDPLRRPLRAFVTGADPSNPDQELLTERLVYGEQHPESELRNLRGKLYLHLDQAGVVRNESHDFKDNPLRGSRRLARQYRQAINWRNVDTDHVALPVSATAKLSLPALEAALAPQLEADTFTSRTTYDALNRPIQVIVPYSDQQGTRRNIIQPVYNESNLLERIHVWLDHPTEPAGLLDPASVPPSPVGVKNIDYDAKGQRMRIDYDNGTITFCEYDSQTLRLTHLLTLRNAIAFPSDCPQPPPDGWSGCQVQNLHYTYDPIGNIIYVRDDAQQTIYFRNKRVEPSAEYTYDAVYRLVKATGREHLGQVGNAPIPHSYNDMRRVGLSHPNDGNVMGTYTELYAYDAVGNFIEMQHRGSDPAHPGWTRRYTYGESSLIEDDTDGTLPKTSNRLSSTTVDANNPAVERYVYDVHGNMTRMPHLGGTDPNSNILWDYRDELHQADLGGGGKAYYVYDASGDRIRKVWEKSATLIEERIYLDGFEIFRRHSGVPGAVTLERETLHIVDDQQRVALVETRTIDSAGRDQAPQQLIRYQYGNHLGSSSFELDEEAKIVSYEEYTPYGSTSYQAVRSQTETPKRHRYTGKERDEETGLYYYGARYYASWLARWTAADPKGLDVDMDLYAYVADNPVRLFDPDGKDWRDSLSWGQRAALWVDDKIQESPVARGVVKNLEKRGEALLNAPKAIAEKYEKEGLTGIGKSFVEGGKHLVKDTADAAVDVGYYGAKAYFEGDPEAKEKAASRALDIVLNVADVVTLAEGAGAVKNAVVGGGKVLAQGGKAIVATMKDAATGGSFVTAEGIVVSGGEALAATGKGGAPLAVANDAAKGTSLMMSQAKNVPGGGSAPKPKSALKQKVQEHHLATNKNKVSTVRGGPWTPRFQKFFEGAGLDINTAKENLVSLVGHAGPHPEAYHQYVFDRLATATKGLKPKTPAFRDAVVQTLEDIADKARTPGTQVNKWLTK